mgnify:CR=1 FL=1
MAIRFLKLKNYINGFHNGDKIFKIEKIYINGFHNGFHIMAIRFSKLKRIILLLIRHATNAGSLESTYAREGRGGAMHNSFFQHNPFCERP